MRISDIVEAFSGDDGKNNTVERDRENLMHIFRRLVFNHTPEVNQGIEGNLLLTQTGVVIGEVEFSERIRDLPLDREMIVVWSYFRDIEQGASKGYDRASRAKKEVKNAFDLEMAKFPLGNYKITHKTKVKKTELEGLEAEYDADLIISIFRVS